MHCYLLAVSADSSLDKYLNNWSLFNLVEQIQVPHYPVSLQLDVHVHLELQPDELNTTFEGRIIMVAEDQKEHPSNAISFKTTSTVRHRIRARGLPIPSLGICRIYFEWREEGRDTWNRAPEYWPLLVELVKES